MSGYLMDLTLLTVGSITPCLRFYLTVPFIRSSPENLNPFSSAVYFKLLIKLSYCWALECKTLSLLTSSLASWAALVASTLGMMVRASANSETAICSLVSSVLAKSSRWMLSAISTAPPPATTEPDSRVLLTTHKASWIDLSISSHIISLAPLTMMEATLSFLSPLKNTKSLSPMASS